MIEWVPGVSVEIERIAAPDMIDPVPIADPLSMN